MQNGEVNNSEYNNIPDSPLESPNTSATSLNIAPHQTPPGPNLVPPEKNKKRLKFILIFSIVALLIVAVILSLFFLFPNRTEELDQRSFEEMFWDSETADEAIETFQKKIDATKDPEEKAALYYERAEYLSRISRGTDFYPELIMDDLTQAFEIYPNPDLAYNIYAILYSYDFKDQAVYYLDKYYELIEGGNEE